jgi:hypothetical protein
MFTISDKQLRVYYGGIAERHWAYYRANAERTASILVDDGLIDGFEEPTILMLDPWAQLSRRIAKTLGDADEITSLAASDPYQSDSRALIRLVPRSTAAAILADDPWMVSALVAAETSCPGGYPLVVATRWTATVSILPPVQVPDFTDWPEFDSEP